MSTYKIEIRDDEGDDIGPSFEEFTSIKEARKFARRLANEYDRQDFVYMAESESFPDSIDCIAIVKDGDRQPEVDYIPAFKQLERENAAIDRHLANMETGSGNAPELCENARPDWTF